MQLKRIETNSPEHENSSIKESILINSSKFFFFLITGANKILIVSHIKQFWKLEWMVSMLEKNQISSFKKTYLIPISSHIHPQQERCGTWGTRENGLAKVWLQKISSFPGIAGTAGMRRMQESRELEEFRRMGLGRSIPEQSAQIGKKAKLLHLGEV